METHITITMTEQEFKAYKELQSAFVKEQTEIETIKHDCEMLAKMVCRALKGIFDGAPRIGLRSATLIYNKAETILREINDTEN